MKVSFHTLGCKVNQYETEVMREEFLQKGFEYTSNGVADVVIINSCTVTAESDRKTRQLVRRCRRDNPDSVIVLTGCMVQAFPEVSNQLKDADIIIGNKNPRFIVEAVTNYINEHNRIFEVSSHEISEKYVTPGISMFSERTRAFMKIEDGCERYCTYCIIPKARGFVRSRALDDIKAEAERLAKSNFSEIVLVGINLSAYGKDTEFNLCDAVDAVCEVEEIKRVRLGSLEPDHISDEMLKRFKAQEKFCPQFHLSLQSGCDETLKRMNRKYDSDFYYDLISRIRSIFPDSSITTDIMVGFAGETSEEFEKSLEFVEKVGFARAHVFAYSRRAGTVAAALKNQVNDYEKKLRADIMSKAVKHSEATFLRNQVNKVFPVLFERDENGISEGYTPNYTRIKIKSSSPLSGQIHCVRITEAYDDWCFGELI